jgi:hypothetical protein
MLFVLPVFERRQPDWNGQRALYSLLAERVRTVRAF